ncbi:hypothetical protein JTB14_021471 [Gonioctena quinquepunctata]|nr:hypothetical protein JTB14_021471 [Gonioctena quinquepunctata]
MVSSKVFDYIFPEDEANKPNLKLLAAAKNWKKQAVQEPEEQVEGTEKDAEKPEDTSATKSSSSDRIREKLLASAKNWKKNSENQTQNEEENKENEDGYIRRETWEKEDGEEVVEKDRDIGSDDIQKSPNS